MELEGMVVEGVHDMLLITVVVVVGASPVRLEIGFVVLVECV